METADVSSLTIGWRHFRTYTANAATSNRSKSYKENRIMKKLFKTHGYNSLRPSGESAQDANRKNEIE